MELDIYSILHCKLLNRNSTRVSFIYINVTLSIPAYICAAHVNLGNIMTSQGIVARRWIVTYALSQFTAILPTILIILVIHISIAYKIVFKLEYFELTHLQRIHKQYFIDLHFFL